MIKLEITPYEQKDLIEILDFALERYEYTSQFDKTGLSKYWTQRIPELKRVVLGKVNPPSMERRK